MLIPALFGMTQSSITVKFTTETASGAYLPFDAVEVNNISQDWSQTLTYPDTILFLNYIDGIGDHSVQEGLSQNFPNPFYGTTEVRFYLSEAEQTDIQIVDMKGAVITQTSTWLNEGEHRISIDLEAPQLVLLRVATAKSSHAIKMLNIGQGSSNRIEVNTVKKEKPLYTKAEGNGIFALGDMMSYTGIATYEGETIYSAVVTQQQNESETITLVFDFDESTLATVTTNSVSGISYTTAVCGGDVTDDGGAEVTARGVCWSTSENPTIGGSHTTDGTGTGSFTSEMTGLSDNTLYYVRAYATNSKGTAYGEQVTFTTTAITTATIVTNDPSYTATTAVCGGNVTDDGGADVTARGVCWNTIPNPTIEGLHTTDGTGTGSFTSNITGLEPNHTYFVRAYATNSAGTAYGNTKSFITSKTIPTVVTSDVSNITATTATCGGNVTAWGGTDVTARGVCWGTSPDPTIEGSHTTNGSGIGSFTSNLTGLTAGTVYYVRAYATNSVGTAYGEQKTFTSGALLPEVTTFQSTWTSTTGLFGGEVTSDGGAPVTARGVCWIESSAGVEPTINNSHTTNGSGTGFFTSNVTGLTPFTTYRLRAYATNSAGTAYGDTKVFTTLSVTPLVSISSVDNVTISSATCTGNLVDSGETAVTAKGFCWSTSQNPTISDSHVSVGTGSNPGNFTSTLTNLSEGTTYYVRAYATNSGGTSYSGTQLSFTTNSRPTGSLSGLFTVSSTKKVYFSQGDLQYRPTNQTYRFAESQLEIMGNANANISSYWLSSWIDLFGWGTGDNPRNTSTSDSDYSSFTDWGCNPISNGGNQANLWRTLTYGEWDYLFSVRSTSSGIRYAKALVDGVKGVIVLPDNWSTSYYTLTSPNMLNVAFSVNTISAYNWTNKFEAHGAVFLPLAGSREGTTVSETVGYYWSSTAFGSTQAYYLFFNDTEVDTHYGGRHYGYAVRLVTNAN